LWDSADSSLLFSDVPRNGVFRWKDGAGVTQVIKGSGYTGGGLFVGREPGSNGLVLDREGRLVMCQHGNRRIVRREPDGRETVLADRYEGKRLNSPNDLVFAANGGDLYFTDPPFGLPRTFADSAKELPVQGVYHLTPDGVLTAVIKEAPRYAARIFGPTHFAVLSRTGRLPWVLGDVLRRLIRR
jgi:gluconolactonase